MLRIKLLLNSSQMNDTEHILPEVFYDKWTLVRVMA